jgi:hypothetical protein
LPFCPVYVFGLIPIHRMIHMHEARDELRQGSASRLRRAERWGVIAVWLAVVLSCLVFSGDWAATGDYQSTTERAAQRTDLLINLLVASAGGR